MSKDQPVPTPLAQRSPLYAHLLAGLTIPGRISALFRGRTPEAVSSDHSRPARPRRAAMLMLGELLPWLIVFGAMVLSLVRGVFYGLVDHGPYDDSWGGPTLAGAWAAHIAVGLLTIAVGAAAVVGLGALRTRIERPAYGQSTPRWAYVVGVFLLIFSVYLLGAWIAQI